MKRYFYQIVKKGYFIFLITLQLSCTSDNSMVIFTSPDASKQEDLAAKEVRRYIYQRTGHLIPIIDNKNDIASFQSTIIITTYGSGFYRTVCPSEVKDEVKDLKKEGYYVKTITTDNNKLHYIVGADHTGTLYGSYIFAGNLGVRFALHGDIIPDEKIDIENIPDVNEKGEPVFEKRGLLPFHDFPEGPDWWTTDDWKSVITQLVKLRMNFIGLHTYPKGSLGPEPTVWIGLPEDCNEDGTVKIGDKTSWHNTQRYGPYGLYLPQKTSEFNFGGGMIFESDLHGPEINKGSDYPFPRTNDQANEMFYRTGKMLKNVFSFAHEFGITTCVGTEGPLNVPEIVKEHLEKKDKDAEDPAVIRELYEGMFTWIKRMYPIDYYWIWGHEGQINENAFKNDYLQAIEAAKNVNTPFQLGICGWGWIADNFVRLDQSFPKDVAFSCINISAGKGFVSPNFEKVSGREKWVIPWLEDDGAMVSPQLWVGRIRKDAFDAEKYGCNGLMGIHWRTRVLDPNISALAQAGWNQGNWDVNPLKEEKEPRFLPVEDFYRDWVMAQFGKEVASEVAAIFVQIDGKMPRPSEWDTGGPGEISVNNKPWEEVKNQYVFADSMAKLRSMVKGSGNLERFEWWLNQFQYTKAMAHLGCVRGELDKVMKEIEETTDQNKKTELAKNKALPLRKELVLLAGEMYDHLMNTLHNTSEMGTIANIEQQSFNRLKLITFHDKKLEQLLEESLPKEAFPWKEYRGKSRIVVPTVRNVIRQGEDLNLSVLLLGHHIGEGALYWRELGAKNFSTIPLQHKNRAVYNVVLPAGIINSDFEYYIEAKDRDKKKIQFPLTVPSLYQTVVVMK